MEPNRRNRISDLYHEALERTPEERSAFLREACEGDEDLREEVESLLRFEPAASPFLETPAAVVVATARAGMVNRQIGSYTIVAPLGAGGMGEVYRARDSKLGRDVAIKILPPHFTADSERRARFAREARTLATLNHPHIGAIYGLEEADGITALVLELVEGPTLADRLERGPLPMVEALAIAHQIAEALEAAHEKGIVHRDLKPANIVLQTAAKDAGVPSHDVRAKVLDFGLAKPMALDVVAGPTAPASGSFDGTADGRILGTPAYMSPEQARGQTVDKRTDIWAFGCVLFEMLARRRAFDGETVTDTIAHILEREPEWAVLPAATPPAIQTLLHRCLRKDPVKRLHDIADALIEIDDVGEPADRASLRDAPVDPRRRERIAWIVSGALAVVSVATTWLYLGAGPSPAGAIEVPIVTPQNWSIPSESPAPSFEISPDGRHLAVAAQSEGRTMLWVSPIDSPAWRSLSGTQGANGFFWSPDSRSIGFFAEGKLKTIRPSGGAPDIICDVFGQAPSGTWSRDDVILFGGSNALRKGRSSGGDCIPVTTLGTGEFAHRWPSFLPDGDHFLYLAQGDRANELRIGSLKMPGETLVLGGIDSSARYVAGHLLFVRDRRLMAQPFDAGALQLKGDPVIVADEAAVFVPWQKSQFSAAETALAFSRTGRPLSRLTWMDRTGKPLGTAGEAGFFNNLDLSPDDMRVAVSRTTERPGLPWNFDIWTIDLARDTMTPLTSHPAREFDPVWSPDGTDIAFISSRIDGKFSLFRRSAGGSGEDELLIQSARGISAPDWSSDRVMIFNETGTDASRSDLWTLAVTGDRKKQEFLKTRFSEAAGEFSPDGRWVAYQSDESGRSEVFVRPFPRDERVFPISRDGGRAARWRGDGKELYFLASDGMLMASRIDNARGFHASVPQPLFQTHLLLALNNHPYDVGRDGERFLIPVILNPPGAAPITVVLNWTARLRR